ncbi:MAG: hypothetical protein D6731_18850, partial [Planctomycetota bacterium]
MSGEGRRSREGAGGRAAKKTVLLTEEFKAKVFDAFKRADAPRAQQLCYEFANENESHARQIYTHLLGIARKNGWIGSLREGAAPARSRGHAEAPPAGSPPPAPVAPLPLPEGILAGPDAAPVGGEGEPRSTQGAGSAPLPLDPLPLPSGILDGVGGEVGGAAEP